MPAVMTLTSSTASCKETAKPVMMLVAWPIMARATKAPMMASGSAKKITTGTSSKWTRVTKIQVRSLPANGVSARHTRTLQRGAIPPGQVRRCRIGALEESQERPLRLSGPAHGLVGQDELAEPGVVVRRIRADRRLLEAVRLRVDVGVEGGLAERHARIVRIAGPEAAGHVLLILRELEEARHPLRERGGPPREACVAQIKRAPEELDGAALADEGGAV